MGVPTTRDLESYLIAIDCVSPVINSPLLFFSNIVSPPPKALFLPQVSFLDTACTPAGFFFFYWSLY